jgi:uncharacterized protein involved in exopolysaccharide biosynthesis
MREPSGDGRTQQSLGDRELRRDVSFSVDTRPDFREAVAVLRLRKWSILALTVLVIGAMV